MDNNTLQIKFDERLNKLGSLDYDNITCWQKAEAYNKAQIEFVRRQVHGNNLRREGDESTKMLIDDLQVLLTTNGLTSTKLNKYYETQDLPANYLYYKRLSVNATSDCCPVRAMKVYLAEVADVDELLTDDNKKPSVQWAETFSVMSGNKIKIYTNNEFELANPILTYYRKPRNISFANCVDTITGAVTLDVISELKDDVIELIIDDAVAILAGDIESVIQMTRNKQNEQTNN